MNRNHRIVTFFGLFVLALAASPVWGQQGFSTIEERMTGKEFSETGLAKLSAEELDALNEWLRAHSVATLSNRNQEYSDTRGFESQVSADLDENDVRSRIKGDFSGWTGKTVFELENGMVWEQAESGSFFVPSGTDAIAIIEKGVFNSWRLKIEGYNKSVRVERVE